MPEETKGKDSDCWGQKEKGEQDELVDSNKEINGVDFTKLCSI